MSNKKIYLLFTHTGSILSSVIKKLTKDEYSHVSIAFDPELNEVYSFGRKRPRNPLIAGFVREDIKSGTLARFEDVKCEIRELTISKRQYERLRKEIIKYLIKPNFYKYNFIGLITAWRGYPLDRDNAYFCSQFVATLLKNADIRIMHGDPGLITPSQILIATKDNGSKLIYKGTVSEFTRRKDNALNFE